MASNAVDTATGPPRTEATAAVVSESRIGTPRRRDRGTESHGKHFPAGELSRTFTAMAAKSTRKLAMQTVRGLRRAGYQSLFAGGCVRDMLLGRRPSDYDVATDATPRQVRKLFGNVLMIGAKFGVAMVVDAGRTIEVATFRSDLAYSDGRRPDAVVFASAEEDALRRDFTINGMFFDPITEEVIDYVDGQADLRRKIIRAIGDPAERFGEDYLRMLRAPRFAARLGFVIDPATARAAARHASGIRQISGERVREELEKMFAKPNGDSAMALTRQLGLAEHVFGPAVTGPAEWSAAMARLEHLARRRDVALALAAVLTPLKAKGIQALTRRWGMSNDMRETILSLCEYVNDWETAADLPLPSFKRLMALPCWDQLRKLWRAEEIRLTGRDTAARRVALRSGKIDPEQVTPSPLVTGTDLKQMGLTEGRQLGQILQELYELQLGEEVTERAKALALARQRMEAG